ncbi:DUF72 domain-containing protein [Rhodocaloribacter litoris]|uniref:DUF72 domain-containing protein n=1 Tax=Rhodocaloribacter litoris TaxID=2558931 RepID=UPI001423EFAA|nr:DUF72 domain-containing protein [Rhodocaloribacter litoris]QXD15213.1 DUF72 domain-containing protein [Rhodocaloribacter litoris]GIV60424.1 MAG: hypothetical protein KatS3mg043_1513 [Rhodothermaceae bacterium]
MPDLSLDERRARVAAYDFRGVHPNARFGTASDRYAGWIGQIYPEAYHAKIKTRRKRLDDDTYEERLLPVASVRDYFEHFEVLELDFTFYRPLREEDGTPSNNLFVLEEYAGHAPATARFLLKAPQAFFARTLRRSRGGRPVYEANPDFLNAAAYLRRFHEPAREVLGERLAGILFEQEYQRQREGPDPMENIAALDGFFDALPDDVPLHLELRSPHLLIPPYFDWLAARGLGFVFSHWTWLPPIREQWQRCGGRFTAAGHSAVARLLTPLRVKYAEAYALAHPFDRPVPELSETPEARAMVLDATALVFQAARQGVVLNLIANNRAWGNAPDLARAIAYRVLEEEERRRTG